MAKNEGAGSAADAGVSTEDNEAAAAAEVTRKMNELLLEEAKASVEGAKAKVQRQKEHLAGAEESLKNAEADLAALKEGK